MGTLDNTIKDDAPAAVEDAEAAADAVTDLRAVSCVLCLLLFADRWIRSYLFFLHHTLIDSAIDDNDGPIKYLQCRPHLVRVRAVRSEVILFFLFRI